MAGIFVPLTPEDVAIDAALALATGGTGNVARCIGKAGEAVATTFKLNKAYSALKGTKAAQQAARVADRVWSVRLRDYPNSALVSAVRNNKLTTTDLQKLNADIGFNPALANKLSEPNLLDAWKRADNSGLSQAQKTDPELLESIARASTCR